MCGMGRSEESVEGSGGKNGVRRMVKGSLCFSFKGKNEIMKMR